MTELAEGVAIGLVSAADGKEQEEEKKESCEWKHCKENHIKKPDYPKTGDVDRNGSYSNDWVGAGLEPWEKYGPGTDSHTRLSDYRNETKKAAYTTTAAAFGYPAYHTQKHHLISVNLFDNVADLSHDAKLIGYDVNHKNNGICLPSYVVDIVQHDLQCHRGSHPYNEYNAHIIPLLQRIELRCIKYCHSDINGELGTQPRLIADLNRLSRRIEGKIKSWTWLLRSNAHQERDRSKARLASGARD